MTELPEGLRFRRAALRDDPRILDLFRASFAREISPSVWDWLNSKCPTGRNRTSLVEDVKSGQLVASYSLLPIRLRFNGQETKASLCTNVNTHPDYQGRGLFTKLGRYALAGEAQQTTRVSLGMPNRKAYPGHMAVGWQVMCPLPFLVKHHCSSRHHSCREVESFDSRMDQFHARLSERFSFIILKDHAFMNWRVAERPGRQYTRFVCEEGQELRGYVVLKQFEEQGYRKAHILDIHADSSEILRELLAAAESLAQGQDELNLWTNPHNPYANEFLACGFSERESQDLLIIHFNYGTNEAVQDGPWWFCLADNDVY